MAVDPLLNPGMAVNVSVPTSRMNVSLRKHIVDSLASAVQNISATVI